ncbi:MAG: hypothetical protein LQ350_004370 [Teloschistes chrysophthalmus]|nr:MAG: hypothetical protein LQ350_004370 [Niorma chrysophthalma]
MYNLFRSLGFCLIILFAIDLGTAAPTPEPQTYRAQSGTKAWNGWESVEKLFVFGASYAGTGFNWLPPNPAPSPSNPLGNSVRGGTSSNGPNFVTYLTTTFNASFIETYNFAFAGAKVSTTATSSTPYAKNPGGQNDMVAQVTNGFLPSYTTKAGHEPYANWTADSSLFISFFGINDILATYAKGDRSFTDPIFAAYKQNLEDLYTAGARNFLILNTPPMELMPVFSNGLGASDWQIPQVANNQSLVRQAVQDFNAEIPDLISSFTSAHSDATMFVYDVHALFLNMLSGTSASNALTSQHQLKPLQNLQTACPFYTQYKPGTRQPVDYLGEDDFDDSRCGGSVGTYFWLNGIHVTWPVHKVMAGAIVDELKAGATGGYEG